jgi:hypothetical protein
MTVSENRHHKCTKYFQDDDKGKFDKNHQNKKKKKKEEREAEKIDNQNCKKRKYGEGSMGPKVDWWGERTGVGCRPLCPGSTGRLLPK